MLVTVTRDCPDPEPLLVLDAIYKPNARRAASRRLPRRHAGAPRGRRLARLGGDRLGHRPADDPARRAVRQGMLQAYVDTDPEVDVVAMVIEDDPRLRRMAASTRGEQHRSKGGHILPVDGGRHLYGVDHGVTFSPTPKLRTVLWVWRGQPLRCWTKIQGIERVSRRPGGGSRPRRSTGSCRGPRSGATASPDRGPAGWRLLPVPVAGLAGDPLAPVLN